MYSSCSVIIVLWSIGLFYHSFVEIKGNLLFHGLIGILEKTGGVINGRFYRIKKCEKEL